MAPEKTIVGATTIGGNDAFVYSDGSMSSLEEIDGVNGTYFILVPVDIEVALKTEDAGNTNYSSLPGYVAPGSGVNSTDSNLAIGHSSVEVE